MLDTKHICVAQRPAEISLIMEGLRSEFAKAHLPVKSVIEVLDCWADKLNDPELSEIPGLAFLRLWLRKTSLEAMVVRELGPSFLDGSWKKEGMAFLKTFPVGIVGHWPAGNVAIQPFISMVCGLLGGNAVIVRVPSSLLQVCDKIIEKLIEADVDGRLRAMLRLVSFDHKLKELQNAIASEVDGAMIWGGEEAVLANRALPFPHWCRVSVFGPRISVACVDKGVVANSKERPKICLRIARDLWQFDQMACSSPQYLFVEKGTDIPILLKDLGEAFEEENRVHPRLTIDPALTGDIVAARTGWLMGSSDNKALYPASPDWTILSGKGDVLPDPVQGKTLFVLEVDDFADAVSRFDGNIQTLGLAFSNSKGERKIVELAARKGVDRVVKLGRMHVFDSPWDGRELIKPMMRVVRYLPSVTE